VSYLLAIETATEVLSVALFSNGRLVEEATPKTEAATHCERLLPEISALLSRNSLTPHDLSAFAADVGPGSFTSLRVGLATVMGLALEKKTQIYPVSSLEGLAAGVEGFSGPIATVLPAGRGMIYGAVFEKSGDALKTIVDESSFFPESFVESLKPFSKGLFVTGTASLSLPTSLKGVTVRRAFPTARSVGLMALSGKISPCSIGDLRIRYLKSPDLGMSRLLRQTP